MIRCFCCGRHGPDCKTDSGPMHWKCWEEHHTDPVGEWPPDHICEGTKGKNMPSVKELEAEEQRMYAEYNQQDREWKRKFSEMNKRIYDQMAIEEAEAFRAGEHV